jgi:MFS family permease
MDRISEQRPHHRTPLLVLLGATTISQVGSMLTLVAIPWFVLQTTGSAAKTGLTGVFEALPYIIAGIFGGTLVDRFGFKRMSVLADVTSGATVALVPLLYHTVGLAFWQLLVLAFLASLFNTPGATARRSLLPDLAQLGGMSLERANAAAQGIPRLATLVGPPLAGVLIAVMGASNVLWFDAATFIISALLIGVTAPPAPAPEDDRAERPGYIRQLAEGIRYVRADRFVYGIMAIFALTNFLDAPISLLYAVYAKDRYGNAVSFGLMFAAFGAGALTGTVLFGAIGQRLPRRPLFTIWLVASMLAYGSFIFRPSLPFTLVILALWGICAGSINPLSSVIYQERIPAALRGRVFGIMTALSFIAIPVGRALAGFALQGFGTRTVFLAITVGYLLVNIAAALNPVLRTLDAPREVSERAARQPSGVAS